ncbi:MAG: hypothetical protein K2K57_01390 [Oscillospiraceae bacterium]|nr:hypothetical protein [Oscillospiraceae bacterium]
MTNKHNIGARRVCAVLLTAALSCTLTGCGEKEPEHPQRPVRTQSTNTFTLPDVDEYRQEADRIREEQAKQTETDVIPEETEAVGGLSETEPFDEENEDWKEGLSFPSATLAPLENEIGESAVNAVTETVADLSGEETAVGDMNETALQISAANPPQTALLANTSAGSETISVSPAAAVNATLGYSGEVSSEYDKAFFESDLFIGDSISTGYFLYGFMAEKNVFAKIGLNPSSVLTKSVPTVYGEITAADMISYTLPKRVYIMLGSNGIQWLSGESMLRSMKSLTEMINLTSPETEIVIVGVPPVTAAYDATVEGMDIMAAVNDYNSGLAQFAAENSYIFVDPGAILKDSTGYFAGQYAEGDGMHFKSATYKVLLSYIEREVTAAEERAAAMAAAEEEAALAAAGVTESADNADGNVSENENAEDDFVESGEKVLPDDMAKVVEDVDKTVKNAVTGIPQEFVTLPEALSAKAEKEAAESEKQNAWTAAE